MAKGPGVRDVVWFVRRRPPFGQPPRDPDAVLPYVGRQPAVNPILPVADMVDAIAFYERLGFNVTSYDPGYAWVKHCGWEFLHLASVDGLDRDANATAAFVHVADADAWYTAMAAAAPDTDIGEIADMPWGMREFSFEDPSGNRVRIGQFL